MTSRTNSILIVVLVVIILVTSFLTWQNMQGSNIPPAEQKEDWKSLTHAAYTLSYPKEATGEAREEESIVYFMGQKQVNSGRTQTELFDGYFVRIGTISPQPTTDLQTTATAERENAISNCHSERGVVSPMKPTTISGQPGYQYSAKECYLDYIETIVNFKNITYRISQSYVGELADQAEYKEITNRITASIRFIK